MPSVTLEYDLTVRKMSTAAFVYNFDSVYFSDFCSTLTWNHLIQKWKRIYSEVTTTTNAKLCEKFSPIRWHSTCPILGLIDIATDKVAWSAAGHILSPAKTTKPIKTPFGEQTYVSPRNHVLDVDHIGATWRIRCTDLRRRCILLLPLL